LIQRAEQSVTEEDLGRAAQRLKDLNDRLEDLTTREAQLAVELDGLSRERDDLMLQKNKDNAALAIQKLDMELARIEAVKKDAETAYGSSVNSLAQRFRTWERVIESQVKTFERAELTGFDPV